MIYDRPTDFYQTITSNIKKNSIQKKPKIQTSTLLESNILPPDMQMYLLSNSIEADTLFDKFVVSDIDSTFESKVTFNPTSSPQPFFIGENNIDKKVIGLNSDKVDGYDAIDLISKLQKKIYSITIEDDHVANFKYSIPDIKSDRGYDISILLNGIEQSQKDFHLSLNYGTIDIILLEPVYKDDMVKIKVYYLE